MLSEQEIFDRAAEHLIKQNAVAMDDGNFICAYLNSKGQKCAIGIFIPDGHEAQLARKTVYNLLLEYPDLQNILGPVTDNRRYQFLTDLQQLHDNYRFNNQSWFSTLTSFANRYNLESSKLSSLSQ